MLWHAGLQAAQVPVAAAARPQLEQQQEWQGRRQCLAGRKQYFAQQQARQVAAAVMKRGCWASPGRFWPLLAVAVHPQLLPTPVQECKVVWLQTSGEEAEKGLAAVAAVAGGVHRSAQRVAWEQAHLLPLLLRQLQALL